MIAPFAELVRVSQTSIAEQNAREAQAGACRGGMNNVCYWHKADVEIALPNVRFWGNSGHGDERPECLLMTQSGSGRLRIAVVQRHR
jgi:hypothetical protein